MGQLAAAVAHEINNPLYAVRNCLYLHGQDLPAELRDSEFMTLARDELTRIAGVIVRMRDFYRPDRGELTPCDLNQVLEETLALAGLNMRCGDYVDAGRDRQPFVDCNSDHRPTHSCSPPPRRARTMALSALAIRFADGSCSAARC